MTTVRELGQRLRSRQISSRDLLLDTFRRIDAEEHFNSFITQTREQALALADERDRELAGGVDRGPFHGIPIAHKDNFYTRDIRTTAGSQLYADFVPAFDADVVTRFTKAGAISVGKTNMHELAFGITSKNPHYGFVLNPRDPSRIAGGSSGGSAALIAAGLLPVGTGTDTGGSIRIPASYCGIVGFKPTYGRVSRRGIVPLSFSLDTAGPLGSCVQDCALAFTAIADQPRTIPARTSLAGLRIATAFFDNVSSEVESLLAQALAAIQSAGARLVSATLPAVAELNAVSRMVQLAETAALYINHHNGALFGSDVWSLIEQGRQIAAHEYVNAQRVRTVMRTRFDAVWATTDLLLAPTTPISAPLISSDTVQVNGQAEDIRLASTRLVRALNLTGDPALSLPCGYTQEGLPVGLQLIGKPGADEELLQVAELIERLLAVAL